MNSVNLIGRVVRDPEKKVLENGTVISKFSIAIDRYYGNKKTEQEELGKPTADFPRIVVWGRQADNCVEYLKKGSLVSILGRVATSKYQKNGENFYTTEIIGDRVQFLSRPKNHEEVYAGIDVESGAEFEESVDF